MGIITRLLRPRAPWSIGPSRSSDEDRARNDVVLHKDRVAEYRARVEAAAPTSLDAFDQAVANVNEFSGRDYVRAHKLVRIQPQDGGLYDAGRRRVHRFSPNRRQAEKALSDARELVAKVHAARAPMDAMLARLPEEPAPETPKQPTSGVHTYQTMDHSDSAVGRLFPQEGWSLSKRNHTPLSADGIPLGKDGAPVQFAGLAAQLETLALRPVPRAAGDAHWKGLLKEFNSIAREIDSHQFAASDGAASAADRDALRALTRLMELNKGSKEEQQLARVKMVAKAFRDDVHALKKNTGDTNAAVDEAITAVSRLTDLRTSPAETEKLQKVRDLLESLRPQVQQLEKRQALGPVTPLPHTGVYAPLAEILAGNAPDAQKWKQVTAIATRLNEMEFVPTASGWHKRPDDVSLQLRDTLTTIIQKHARAPVEERMYLLHKAMGELRPVAEALSRRQQDYADLAEKTNRERTSEGKALPEPEINDGWASQLAGGPPVQRASPEEAFAARTIEAESAATPAPASTYRFTPPVSGPWTARREAEVVAAEAAPTFADH